VGTGENLEKTGHPVKQTEVNSQQFYHQVVSPRVKNRGQIRICVLLVTPLMAGKELEVDTQVSVPDKLTVRSIK